MSHQMADRRLDILRREISRAFPDRPFAIELWDGGRVPPTSDAAAPTIRFRSPLAISQLLRAPSQLGLGRAYVLGEIETDDLDAFVALMGRWQPPSIGPVAGTRLLLAGIRAAGLHRPPPPPAAELHATRRRHTRNRDAEAVRHHYDVSNEFFALFLDESMTYSCALFEEGTETLEDAQRAKLELICTKLELRDGMRMLDVGSGWGSLAIHAAREHGASILGITLSPPQAELARARAREAGVGDRVEFRVLDYRELEGESFDAIASIGMVEHVGERNIDEYARRLASLLRPEGRILNHGIVHVPPVPNGAYLGGKFMQRYVFPDGELLNIWRMQQAFERAELETLHIENLHSDYAETLRHWAARLDQNLDAARALAGEERLRVWRLYLRAARNSFEVGQSAVVQLLCSAVLSEPPTPAPSGGRHAAPRRRVPTPRG
jgi:cyclopropane-fatty-acyl-phospholipid synthase